MTPQAIALLLLMCVICVSGDVTGSWSGSGIMTTVEVTTEVKITMTGPNVGWYSIGFGGSTMTAAASAIVVDNANAPVEKVLGSQSGGTDPPAVLTVVSNTVNGANRVVVVTRPIAGASGTYSFPTSAGDIAVIWAHGTAAYAYHATTRGSATMTLAVPPAATPVQGTWSNSAITASVATVGTDVRITLTVSNVGWYSIGFGGSTMTAAASAIVVDNANAPVEKVLGSQSGGTDPPAVLTVVSNTVNGANRVVVVTRPIAGASGTYSFPTSAGDIAVIWAHGTAAYAYHATTRGSATMTLAVPPAATPVQGTWSNSAITASVATVGTDVRITLTVSNVGWYSIGFGGSTMTAAASAIVVDNANTPVEKVLGSQSGGTDPPAVLTVVSNTVNGANRVVVVTRPIAGASGTYSFPTSAGDIAVIWAHGTAAYAYHATTRGSATMTLAAAGAAPSTLTPTLVPTNAPPTAVPTNAPPTAVPTNAPPTAVPTNAPPTAVPTNAPPTAPTTTSVAGGWSNSAITASVATVGTNVRITLTGSNVGWYSIGFGGPTMTAAASAIVVENGKTPFEKVLGSQSGGTDPPAVLTMVSNTVNGANRVVVVTRPIAGASGTYSFPTSAGEIDVIWAHGTAAYTYHQARGSAKLMFVSFASTGTPSTAAPISDAPPTAVPTGAPPTPAPPSISTISSAGIVASEQTTGVSVDVRFSSTDATISVKGPQNVWFGVAFGQQKMAPTATAFIITSSSPVVVEERTLVARNQGTLVASLQGNSIVSDTIVGGLRQVVFKRSMAGQGNSFTFDTTATSVDVMVAAGETSAYASGHSVSKGFGIGSSAQVFSQQFSLSSINFDDNKFKIGIKCQVGHWCGIALGSMENGRSITCREPGLCENSKLVISGPQPEATQKVTVAGFATESGFYSLTATFDEANSGFVSGAKILWGVGTAANGNLNKHGGDQRGSQFLSVGGNIGDGKSTRLWLSLLALVIILFIGVVSSLMYSRYCKNGPDFFSKMLFTSNVGTIVGMVVIIAACALSYFASYYTDDFWWYGTANPARITLTMTLFLCCGSVGQFIKISRERLLTYHRWLGVLFLIFSSIHGIGYIIDSSKKDILDVMWKTDEYKGVAPLHGVLCLIFTFVMFLLSFIRRKWYHIFLYSHWISAHLVVVFSCLHASSMIIPVAAASFYICCFAIYKFIQPAAVVSEKFASRDGQYTRLKIAIKNRKPSSYGSYYNIGVKGDKFHSHPFSVVKDGATVDFVIKNMGPGTSTEYIIQNVQEGDTVRMEGPFGVPTVLPYHYDRVILCGGGVGVTPLIGIMNLCATSRTFTECEMQSTPGNPEAARVHLHWSCRDITLLELIAPYICDLGSESSVHTFLYYTGKEAISQVRLPSNVTVVQGRPAYDKVFSSDGSLFKETNDGVPVSDVGVFTCGPDAMENAVVKAIGSCGYKGALVVHSETFLM